MNTSPILHRVDTADQTIAERIAWIEQVLKYQPPALVPYRRQMIREYLDLTTDPEERHAR